MRLFSFRIAFPLFVFATLMGRVAFAQSKVPVTTVTGTGFTALAQEPVYALRAVPGGYLNCFYKELAPVATIRQGQFRLDFAPRPGGELVSLQAKTFPQLYAFVEPGNSPVQLHHTGSEPVSEATLVFEGPNAAGNNLLLQGRLANRRAGVDQEVVRQLMASATTPQAMLANLHAGLRRYVGRLDSVRQRQLISPACYASLRALTEQEFCSWAYTLLNFYRVPENRDKLQFQLPEAGLRQVLASLVEEFDPSAPRYRGQFIAAITAQQVYHFRAQGWLPGPAPVRYWNRYAAQFKDTNSIFGDVDYAPAASQPLLIGDELLTALTFHVMSDADFATVLADYGRHFPTSPYGPVLKQALQHEQAAAATLAPGTASLFTPGNPNQDLGRYDEASGQLTFAPLAGLDTLTSVASLVRREFAGRPVFVDFWATWCAPCLSEFNQEPALHAFLEQQGIEPLYISVNKAGFRPKWREFVKQYQLRGSHYLANEAVQKSLAQLLARGIPRYLLFDAQGRLVDDDLPLPSTGEVLRARIRQKLAVK